MKTESEIKLAEHKVIHIKSEGSIPLDMLLSKIDNQEQYHVLCLDFLNDEPGERGFFGHFCSELSILLDKVNLSTYQRTVHQFSSRFFVVLVLLFACGRFIHDSEDIALSVNNRFGWSIPSVVLDALAILVVLAIPALLFWPSLAEKLGLSWLKAKPMQPYNDKVQQLVAAQNLSFNSVDSASKNWFQKEKKYLFIWLYPNWADVVDGKRSKQLFRLMAAFLKKNDNLHLIYVTDAFDYDLSKKELDTLGVQLNTEGISLPFEVEWKGVSIDDLLLKVEARRDADFYRFMHRALHELDPGKVSLQYLSDKLDPIHREFTRQGYLRLENYFSPYDEPTNGNAKFERLNFAFFNKKNAWDEIDPISREFLLLVFLHQYLMNSSTPKALCSKFFILYKSVELQHKGISADDLKTEVFLENCEQCKNALDDIWGRVSHDLNRMQSLKFSSTNDSYELEADPWVVDFIVSNKDHFDFPNDELLSNLHELATFFFFYYASSGHAEQVPNVIWKKLLEFIPVERHFVLRLLLADALSHTPFELDRGAAIYVSSSQWALSSWLEYLNGREKSLDFTFDCFRTNWKFSDKALQLKPFRTLYQLVWDTVNRAAGITCTVDDLMKLVDKIDHFLDTEWRKDFEVFRHKANEIFVRYTMYKEERLQSPKGSEYFPYPYNELFYAIEKKVLILLPIVADEDVVNIPFLNIDEYWKSDSDSFDFMFLLLLCFIHNHFACITDKNGGKNIVARPEYPVNSWLQVEEKLRFVEQRLLQLQRKKLNYKKYNYFNLYLLKFRKLTELLDLCGFEFQSDILSTEQKSMDVDTLAERFGLMRDYYGEADTLFWHCWFNTRLMVLPRQLEIAVHRLLDICEPQKLGYFHFDGGLIYFALVTKSSIPPQREYDLIHKFFRENPDIPEFLYVQFLSELQIVCYNGQFKNRSALKAESIEILEELLNKFPHRMKPSEIAHQQLALFSLYYDDHERYMGRARELAMELESKVDQLDVNNRGLFYYRFLRYLHKVQDVERIQNSDYYQMARIYLKDNKFYYIQFLRDCVNFLDAIMGNKVIKDLAEQHEVKRLRYNEILDRLSAEDADSRIEKRLRLDEKSAQTEQLNVLGKELDELTAQIKREKNRKDSILELEEEFNEYHKNFRITNMLGADNHSSRYLIAATAHTLALDYHQKGLHADSVRSYYEMAMENYYELEEWPSFLSVALELKIMWAKTPTQSAFIHKIEGKVRNMIHQLESSDPYAFHLPLERKAESLAYLVHDFFNEHIASTRTDNKFMLNTDAKVDKNRSGYKQDRDTKGFRKSLSLFMYHLYNENDLVKAIQLLEQAFEYAKMHTAQISHDDLDTLQQCILRISQHEDGKNSINMTKTVIQLETVLDALWDAYRAYVQQGLRSNLS